MKVIILAGGLGSRLSEETSTKPKPMVEIGGKPILWHIMKIYSFYGFNEFVILCGYKGYMIKEYFSNYYLQYSDITVDLKNNSIDYHNIKAEPWKITLIDTGTDTMTGGRIKRVQQILGNDTFMLTYGDGIANINLNDLVSFHRSHKGEITMTAAQPEGRFGALDINENGKVSEFVEKPKGDGAWINAGFFVCETSVLDYIKGDDTVWEKEPLRNLAKDGKLFSYKHHGFWHPMDTIRDRTHLDKLYQENNAPWKIW
jgi:glucose-1-phosphate cytidylyltransferase